MLLHIVEFLWVTKFNLKFLALWIPDLGIFSNFSPELITCHSNSVQIHLLLFNDSSSKRHNLGAVDVISRNHSDVNLVSFIIVSLEGAIPDVSDRLVNVVSQWVFHTEGSKINEIIFELVSEFLLFNIVMRSKLVEIFDADFLESISQSLLTMSCHGLGHNML